VARDPDDIARIAALERLLAVANERLAEMAEQLKRMAEALAKLSGTSRNSSRPPSQDPPGTTRPSKPPSGRRRGGQPGHKGSRRELLPPERVTQVVDHDPVRCDGCEAALDRQARGGEPDRHQVIDLPPIAPVVVEHRCHAKRCARCGAVTTAGLPADVPRTTLGPTVAAFVAVMTAKYQLSKRNVQEMLVDFLGIEVSLGEVCNLEQRVSGALERPYDEALAAIQRAERASADETGWRQDKERAWLWLATSPFLAVFRIDRNRGGPAARALLGDKFAGILNSDRWSAYAWIDVARRQLCWAHLIRNSQGVVDLGGPGARFGCAMLNFAKRMMRWWHQLRDGTIERAVLQRRMQAQRRAVGKVLAWGRTLGGKAAAMANDLTKLEPAMWTFADHDGVEPTNNLAERDLRAAVIWRKTSFGTDSACGSRFVERMLTTVASLRKQGRGLLRFLADALAAAASLRRRPPSLLRQA
jgi:transposase